MFVFLGSLNESEMFDKNKRFCGLFSASCRVPAENETKFRVTAVNGQRLKTNDTLPNGTILRLECINKQGEYEKQRTVTCLAGRWSGPIC